MEARVCTFSCAAIAHPESATVVISHASTSGMLIASGLCMLNWSFLADWQHFYDRLGVARCHLDQPEF